MESGISKKPNILILTSFLSNDSSSRMVFDMVKSLEEVYHVDVLTKYPFESSTLNVISAYNGFEQFLHKSKNYLFHKYNKIVLKSEKPNIPSSQYYFFGLNEEKPPVKTKKIVNKIKKDYDFVLVFFWQGLLTSKTLRDISNKRNTHFLLFAADMFPITGGCSYSWGCDRLGHCGKCPGLSSTDDNDITRENYLAKRKFLNQIDCVFMGNSWQVRQALTSELFKFTSELFPIVNEDVFKPQNKIQLKQKYNYTGKKILFFGAFDINEERKGVKFLLESLVLLSLKRPDLVKDIVLLIAGHGGTIEGLEAFEVSYTGHLTFDRLAETYALSDIFLSPTIQDSGPMMLNQSLMCGTPAVAFEIGTACDIINVNTGYLAKYKDSNDFCKGIIELITKSDSEMQNMRNDCRKQSLGLSSYSAFRDNITNAYKKLKI